MGWEESVNPSNIKRLSNFTQYSGNQPPNLDIVDPDLPQRIEDIEKENYSRLF